MPLLLLLGAAVVVAAAVLTVGFVRRRRFERRAAASMRRRLEEVYPPGAPREPALPLRAPAGRVAVEADGLYLGLGQSDLRHVPWQAIRNVSPVAGGRLTLHVARVGDIEIPGTLGRRIWEGVGAESGVRASTVTPR